MMIRRLIFVVFFTFITVPFLVLEMLVRILTLIITGIPYYVLTGKDPTEAVFDTIYIGELTDKVYDTMLQ